MILGVTLYLRNSVEAVDFYKEAFGMTLGYHVRHSDGTFLHAELEKNGRCVFSVSESGDTAVAKALLAAQTPPVNCGIDFDSEDEIRHAYVLLAEEGHVLRKPGPLPWSDYSADVVDKYGVSWFITLPNHRPAEE